MSFPDFKGNQFSPDTASYNRANDLYATSTYGEERDMKPGKILQPTSIEDIQHAIKCAVQENTVITIKTGGHQYSGASSTGPGGIMLDLMPTFRRPKLDLHLERDPGDGKLYLHTSVSWTLAELYDFLLDNGVFMPTGQCTGVCLGGHVQTGGFGMLARSFGLLADYVREFKIVDYNGDVVVVNKKDNPDLFYGFLGGSPGNFGVLTHVKIEVQEDKNFEGSKGLWVAFNYRPDTLKALLDILVEKGEDPDLPRGYDFTVNIVSRGINLLDLFPGSKDELRKELPDDIDNGKNIIADLLKFKFALIVVYAQWVNIGGDEPPYSPDLFNRIVDVPHTFKFFNQIPDGSPMSVIASKWLFRSSREFPYPYVKRTNNTNSVSLSQTGWAEWFAGRIHEIVKDKGNGLWISSQLQVKGGKNSMFQKFAGNGTSFSFRDATFGGTWDVFYQPGKKEEAEQWQAVNDQGRESHFSKDDRRLLWGSYGDWDMTKVWPFYYSPDTTYKRLQQIRKTFDPNGTFTPNPFCVEALQ